MGGTRRVAAATMVLMLSPVLLAAQSVSARLEAYLDTQVREEGFSGSVLVSFRGRSVLARGYGYANAEHAVANTTRTKFAIGSITKQFTAMAILILAERGRLHLDDTLGDHLPDVPDQWQDLTLHQLLTHTSGLMHSWALPGFRETMMIPAGLDETVERFREQPLLSRPGQNFAYSGLGYFLLAQVIEARSHLRFGDFLDREIFQPLGMEDTGSADPPLVLEGRAEGYVQGEDGLRRAPAIHLPILTGGGDLYSTARDMMRWDRALRDGELIGRESYREMYTPRMNDYGYGWLIRNRGGRRTVSHSGGVPGFTSLFLRYPDDELSVVVLSNMTPVRPQVIALSLADIVLDGGR